MNVRIGILGSAHPNARRYADLLTALPGVDFAGSLEGASPLEDRALNGVIICAGIDRRRALVEQAAAHAKAILCESPLAATVADGEAIIAACTDAGVALYTTLPYRFHPAYRRLRQAVHAGELGTLIGARTGTGGGGIVDKRLGAHTARWERAVVLIDLLRDLAQAEPVSVYAANTLLTVTFDSGFFATVDAGYSSADAVSITLTGTDGTAELDLFAQNHVLVHPAGVPSLVNWGDDIYRHLLIAFVAAVSGTLPGDAPLTTGADGLASARIVLPGYSV